MKTDTIQRKERAAEILLVEDNYGDVILTKKAFHQAKISNHITVAASGEQALEILRRQNKYADAPRPDIIFLDLNLPKKSGKDVLRDIKADDRLKHIPVVVLTSSHAELDVIKTYNLHANSYIIKPISLEKFYEVVSAIESYWFSLVVSEEKEEAKK